MTVDREAQELFDHIMTQLIEQEGISEQLKEHNQIAWIRAMNTIRNIAEEIVNDEITLR